MDELADWLTTGYVRAYRTACLILRNPADAEEAVQEAYLRIWRFRDAVPAGDGRTAWLYRVVVNACLSRLRADATWRARSNDEVLTRLPSSAPGPEDVGESSALGAAMLRALATLPVSLRTPVVLRYYAGLSEREIATAIGRRPGTVKSRLYEARRRLAEDPALAAWADETAEVSR